MYINSNIAVGCFLHKFSTVVPRSNLPNICLLVVALPGQRRMQCSTVSRTSREHFTRMIYGNAIVKSSHSVAAVDY